MTNISVEQIRFGVKEVIYISLAGVAYFTQLSILSNKIESNKHKNELTFANHDWRLTALEAFFPQQKFATLPSSPKVPEKPKEEE